MTATRLTAAGLTAMTIAVGAAVWGTRHAAARSVRNWHPGGGSTRRAGMLHVREFGSGETVVLLLHGMAAAGNSFGAAFNRLGDSAQVVVPDLLGFGGSMVTTVKVSGENHLDALDSMLAELGLAQSPLVVVGHSMGGPLALRFAARHTGRVRAVFTLCGALYRDGAEADARIALMGPFEAALTGEGWLPYQLCAWVCRHRSMAAWAAVALRPDLPVLVARSAVLHTWDSYRGALAGLLRAPDWEQALYQLDAARITVVLVEGGADPVPVPGRAAALAEAGACVRHVTLEQAPHLLPLSDGDWCAALIADHLGAEESNRASKGLTTLPGILDVSSRLAPSDVGAGAADASVCAGTAHDAVVAFTGREPVVAHPAEEHVCACGGPEQVVASTSPDRVPVCADGHAVATTAGTDDVVAALAPNAVRAAESGDHIAARATGEDVRPRSAPECP